MTQPAPTQQRLELSEAYAPLIRGPLATRYVLVTGGRGSGKSFAVAISACLWARQAGTCILFTRYTLTAAADSAIPEFEEKLDRLQVRHEFRSTLQSVEHLGAKGRADGHILFRGIKTSSGNQTAKLKSLQGVNVWICEEAAELDDPETFDVIDLSVRDARRPNIVLLVLNPPHKAHWLYGRFFQGVPPEFCGVAEGVTYIHTTYLDNAKNLPPDYLALARRLKATNPPRYNHIWRGHWAEQAEGALWTWEIIDRHRHREGAALPEFARIVVAIDPAVTNSEASDETGIVCAAQDGAGHYYLLSDLTRRASPLEWATVAVGEYRSRKADRIVAEVNNGGDMVEATLRNVDLAVSYAEVHASRGKMVRAEPVAALYEQGLVHHVGSFAPLETELMTYTGASNDASPNRMDALVWALTSLMEGAGRPEFDVLPQARALPNRRSPGYIDLTPNQRRQTEGSFADVY